MNPKPTDRKPNLLSKRPSPIPIRVKLLSNTIAKLTNYTILTHKPTTASKLTTEEYMAQVNLTNIIQTNIVSAKPHIMHIQEQKLLIT